MSIFKPFSRPSASPAAFRALGLGTGLLLSIAILWFLFEDQRTQFEEVALNGAESRYAVIDGVKVHCKSVEDADDCVAPALTARWRFLWLGNSQIHAINQRKPGDRTAPEILHQTMQKSLGYLVSFSEPNANLQEHLTLFAYLLPRLKPSGLILPVVFDDFRESGIRADILPALKDEQTRRSLSAFEIGRKLIGESSQTVDSGEFAGIASTLQERSERAVSDWLSDHWALWAVRSEARGQTLLFLYRLRNYVFRINPSSKRKIIAGRYTRNWAALEAILSLAEKHRVSVLVYVPPLRRDVPMPYDEGQYAAFKQQVLLELRTRPNVRVSDLERVVDDSLWGTKAATTMGGEQEYDFMHFQGKGHEALARELDALALKSFKQAP